ncbi:hypothetical protein M413DRAFT_81723 [Hebeloma cylindrosporum]|uniref:Uncharacterized protein n=1 Tax=Hebeloma cylindrosporum TaxID=76867 RepID=A0A0C2Z612_HEBCY|nr:hypothetical protein M413DRAFT_81723 [Hebeloma cylindrosporum h7]
MNSPPEIGSPSPSTPSSGSPPPEEAYQQIPANASSSYISNLTSHIGAAFGAQSSSKRRLPTGSSFGAASSSRDTKTRRRAAEPGRTGGGPWESSSGKKEKDELIDTALVEYLRKEIGDPFLEQGIRG